MSPWGGIFTDQLGETNSRPALALVGPACHALESAHPGNAPAGLTAGSGRGRETGFAPLRIWVEVTVDRRRGERRQGGSPPGQTGAWSVAGRRTSTPPRCRRFASPIEGRAASTSSRPPGRSRGSAPVRGDGERRDAALRRAAGAPRARRGARDHPARPHAPRGRAPDPLGDPAACCWRHASSSGPGRSRRDRSGRSQPCERERQF
jgi:hypothetical protein